MTAITNPTALHGALFSAGNERLAALLERGLGLAPTATNIDAFIEQCQHRAAGLGISDIAYFEMLASGAPSARTEWMALAPVLTVGETFLFRDARLWKLIECTLLPSVASLTRPLWMWSAGCSTGEETYTLAIVARRALRDGNFSILGTDVNPKAIAAARVGVYTPWSLRGVSNAHHDGLIVSATQTVRIHDDVKSNVRFEVHNLSDPNAYPPAGMQSFECIVCRNVLIYMTAGAKAAIVHSLARCLTPGGVLILGHGEATGIDLGGLLVERHDAGVVYRKPLVAPTLAAATTSHAPKSAVRKSSAKPGTARSARVPARGKPEAATLRSAKTDAAARTSRPSTAAAETQAQSRPLEQATRARELLSKALVQARAGNIEAGERHAHAAITLNPLEPDPYVLLAALLASRDAFKEAEIALKRALFLDPMYIPALWQLGTLYRLTNKARQATYTFARLLARLEGLPPEKEALPFDSLSVDELTTLLRAALDEAPRE